MYPEVAMLKHCPGSNPGYPTKKGGTSVEIRWNNTPIEEEPAKQTPVYNGPGVAPMCGPSGLIFAMRAQYEQKKAKETENQEYLDALKRLALEYKIETIPASAQPVQRDERVMNVIMATNHDYVPVRMQDQRTGQWKRYMMPRKMYDRIMSVVHNKQYGTAAEGQVGSAD